MTKYHGCFRPNLPAKGPSHRKGEANPLPRDDDADRALKRGACRGANLPDDEPGQLVFPSCQAPVHRVPVFFFHKPDRVRDRHA